jgi:hypothetical protein
LSKLRGILDFEAVELVQRVQRARIAAVWAVRWVIDISWAEAKFNVSVATYEVVHTD